MQYISLIADIWGALGVVFALLAWLSSLNTNKIIKKEQNRQNKKIEVVLQYGGQSLRLPVELRRAELTRAEILGRIGMISMKEKGKRFSLSYLSKREFLEQINQIANNETEMILTIPCNNDEYEQFDIESYES